MRHIKTLFWLIFIITLGVYGAMLVWSLPLISGATGGLLPFDLRPGGYDFAQAQTFLAALPEEVNSFYRHTQLGILDTAYPALLALTLFLAIGLLAQRWLKLGAWVVALIAIPGAIFDYMENANIKLMLFLGPDNITPEIVARASDRTVSKSSFISIAMLVLLLLLLAWAFMWFRNRRQNQEV